MKNMCQGGERHQCHHIEDRTQGIKQGGKSRPWRKGCSLLVTSLFSGKETARQSTENSGGVKGLGVEKLKVRLLPILE